MPDEARHLPMRVVRYFPLHLVWAISSRHLHTMSLADPNAERRVVFISKGTPEDDQFVLWLAPRLEAHGYEIFADILTLQAGDRWRKEITQTLQSKSAKMLLCCSDVTLNKDGVQEEIGMAAEVSRTIKDKNFVIPLRLSPYKRVFGIGELQRVDFATSWSKGLQDLLETLEKQNVPRNREATINPTWDAVRRRYALSISKDSERLTSNWLRIVEVPDTVRYFQPTGTIDAGAMKATCSSFLYPAELFLRGFFSFASHADVLRGFDNVGRFAIAREVPFQDFLDSGIPEFIRKNEAHNLLSSMLRKSWENHCRTRGLLQYSYSGHASGFHASENLIGIGKKVPWGRQGDRRRSAMLRNKAQGRVWQFGVTGNPWLTPFPHFRLKARVLFAAGDGEREGQYFDDRKLQHRLRRTICKGWRNKQWHGRLMAFLELLSGEEATIKLPIASDRYVRLDASPILFTSPVTTTLPDVLSDEDEEIDGATFGAPTFDDTDDE